MNWYHVVSNDIGKLPDAITYYESEYLTASKECKLYGSIEKAAASMPGIVEIRFAQIQEIEAILEYMNIEMRQIRSRIFKKYLENYNRALSSRDCERYVDGDIEVVEYAKLINELALLRNKWLGISRALDQKQWQITNIVKLRCAGLDDASI